MHHRSLPIDGEPIGVRLLRHRCGMRDYDGEGAGLSRLLRLGQILLSPAGSVALTSFIQPTDAMPGRCLVAECCCSRCLSGYDHALIQLLGGPTLTVPPAPSHLTFPTACPARSPGRS